MSGRRGGVETANRAGTGVLVLLVCLIGGGLFLVLLAAAVALVAYVALRSQGPPAAAAAARDRLLGTWDADTLDGGKATLEFRPDGSLEVAATRPGQNRVVRLSGTWDLVGGSGDRLRIRRATPGTAPRDDDVLFQGPDQFTIEGERGGLTYHRRR
jgi:hypothetical protein